MFGHSHVPLFVSAQPVLMGFLPVSFQHWHMGTFSYTACFFTYCISSSRAFRTKTESNHPPLASSQYLQSNRIQLLHNLSTFTPPTALLQNLGCQVEGPDLCSTCCVHRGGCVVCVADLLPKTLADLNVQILATIGAFHLSGNMWAVREEAHSFSVTPVSSVTERVEDIMPALQAKHARERELRCIATEVVQEPGSSPDLLMVQDCSEHYACHTR